MTSSFDQASGETLILAIIRTVTGFSAANTSIGDWKILNSGKAKVYAIIKPGKPNRKWISPRTVENTFQSTVQIWRKYENDGSTTTNLENDTGAAVSKIDQYHHLGDTTGTISDASIANISEILEMWKGGGGPIWLRQDITVTWKQEKEITYLE